MFSKYCNRKILYGVIVCWGFEFAYRRLIHWDFNTEQKVFNGSYMYALA